MKKRLVCLFLAALLLIPAVPCAFAYTREDEYEASLLHGLGLFQGTGTSASGQPEYSLGRQPTRAEAVTMLVRMLGKEDEARAGNWTLPFTDVSDWSRPYVGYAYANGLVSGTSDTTYSGDDKVTNTQYITMILRALGYETGTDFQWDRAWILSDRLGITNGCYVRAQSPLSRGDVVEISYQALKARLKGSDVSLGDRLAAEGVFSQEAVSAALSADPYAASYSFSGDDMLQYYWDLLQHVAGAEAWMNDLASDPDCIRIVRTQCLPKAKECTSRIIDAARVSGYEDVVPAAEAVASALDMVLAESIPDEAFPQQYASFISLFNTDPDGGQGISEHLGAAIESHGELHYPEELLDAIGDYLAQQ